MPWDLLIRPKRAYLALLNAAGLCRAGTPSRRVTGEFRCRRGNARRRSTCGGQVEANNALRWHRCERSCSGDTISRPLRSAAGLCSELLLLAGMRGLSGDVFVSTARGRAFCSCPCELCMLPQLALGEASWCSQIVERLLCGKFALLLNAQGRTGYVLGTKWPTHPARGA